MNKAIYLCAAAAMALASCSNDETVEMAKGNAISFRTVTGLNTRGVETTQTNLETMHVTGYEENGTGPYLDATFERENDTNIFVEQGGTHYWTKNTIHFLALSPAADDWNATKNISFANNAISATFTDVTPAADVANQKDLMIGNASGKSATGGLPLTLNHVLSQIQIQAKNTNQAYVYEIKGVRIASVASKGSYSFPTTGWTVGTEKTTYDVILDQAITLDGKDQNPKNLMKQVGQASDNAMLIPQALTAWAGDKDHAGDNFDNGSYISLLLNVKSAGAGNYVYPAGSKDDNKTYGWAAVAVGTTWEAGKKYIYTLDLSNGAGKVDPVEPNPDPENPTVTPGKDDNNKGEDIMGDPIKFDVTVTGWEEAFKDATKDDGNLNM